MILIKLADAFLRFSRLDAEDPELARLLMLKINTSPHHYITVDEMTEDEREIAEVLFAKRWLDYIPADKRVSMEVLERNRSGDATLLGPKRHLPSSRPIPERYVLTGAGSHGLQTFIDTMDKDLAEHEEKKKRVVQEPTRHRVDISEPTRQRVELLPDESEMDWGEDEDDRVQVNRTLDFSPDSR